MGNHPSVLYRPIILSIYIESTTLLCPIVHIEKWFVQPRPRGGLVRFGRPKRTGRRRPRGPVLLEANLEPSRGLLVRPTDASLHFPLNGVERVPLDEGFVRSGFHAPAGSREPAVHGVAEDVGDGLTRPRAPCLRPVPETVQLLADLRDPAPFEVAAEDEPNDLRFFIVHLESAVDVSISKG